jgi:flagellin-like hook-associated protein FlgL
MTRVNTNVSSLTAQNRLNKTNVDLQTALTRLSTGLRINSGKDDPAGLIASESLRSDITSINKALSNTNRANQIIGTADSALGQVSSLLNDIRGLVTEAANNGALSPDEIAANQLQIDSSLEAINRIAQTTTFQGRRLLDGSLDFQVAQGTNYDTVKDLQIDSANLGAAGNVAISVDVTAAATKAKVTAKIAADGASAAASAKLTFNDGAAASSAAGTISFGASYTAGLEATTDLRLDNAYGAFVEANGTLTLASGAALKLTAKNGTVVDGAAGNATKINVVTGAATASAFDEATNTLTLTIQTGQTGAQIVTALNAETGATAAKNYFTLSNGNATAAAAGDVGLRTGVLSGGTDTVATTRTQSSANGVIFQSSAGNNYTFDIDAVAGGSFDGARGAATDFIFTIANSGGTSATYDAANNTVTLAIDRSQTTADIQTAINTGLSGQFAFTNVATNGTVADVTTATTVSNPLTSAGTDTVVTGAGRAGLTIKAADGGLADGLIGNSTKLVFTAAASGTATTAVYDAVANKLNITVGKGATLNQIAAAINTEGTFSASNAQYGTYKFAVDASGPTATADLAVSPTFTTGTNIVAASAFKLTAVAGGLADGTVGNSTKVKFATGSNTSATYDSTANELNIVVAATATIQNVYDAINNGVGSVFTASNLTNGAAKFDTTNVTDLATRTGALTSGANSVSGAKDEIIVTAAATGATPNGLTITFQEDANTTAGTADATVDNNGNIVVKVNNSTNTSLDTIVSAINGLADFNATLSLNSNGDGLYRPTLETPPAAATFANGVTGGGISADLTIQLTGGSGSEVFKFQKGATRNNLVQSVNLLKDATGISAKINDDGDIDFESVKYGSEGVVGIEVLSEGVGGSFGSSLVGGPRAVGTDIAATVNGTVATGQGNTIKLNTSTLSFNLTVADGSALDVNFNITGGGALFQLGPDVVSNQQARLGISSLNTAKIGGVSGKLFELSSSGARSLTKDVTTASAIVDEVINKVTTLRGRLGAFQRTALESNIASLNDTLANLNEAQSSIRDADFAKESANLTRAQILVQSGTSVLGIANQSSQSVLSLLR